MKGILTALATLQLVLLHPWSDTDAGSYFWMSAVHMHFLRHEGSRGPYQVYQEVAAAS